MTLILITLIALVSWLFYTIHLKKVIKQGKVGKLKLALIGLGIIFFILAVTGRAPALFAIIGAGMTQIMRLAPLLIRYAPWIKQYLGGGIPASGAAGASQLATATVVMTLNHHTGGMTGQVIAGDFVGRAVESLTTEDLKSLCDHCAQHDPDALRLLHTYLMRERASEWEGASQAGGGQSSRASTSNSSMGIQEAKQLLGLEDPLTKKAIVSAHRSLMGKFHPDKGGNDYLATKLNTARDVLLKKV